MLALATLAFLPAALAAAAPHITQAPAVGLADASKPTTTVTTCTSSSIEYPAVASGFNLHHVCRPFDRDNKLKLTPRQVCGTQCTAEYPLCNCVQYSLYSWYCGPDPYDTDSSTYYGCCQDWGNGTYGCFCDGTPGA
jgi:hypothetical protein